MRTKWRLKEHMTDVNARNWLFLWSFESVWSACTFSETIADPTQSRAAHLSALAGEAVIKVVKRDILTMKRSIQTKKEPGNNRRGHKLRTQIYLGQN
jgi:hypothetical protein